MTLVRQFEFTLAALFVLGCSSTTVTQVNASGGTQNGGSSSGAGGANTAAGTSTTSTKANGGSTSSTAPTTTSASGGSSQNGGTSSATTTGAGGAAVGGTATGGTTVTASGGAMGGASKGGSSATGGAATGGTTKGGASATGGAATGGTTKGGSPATGGVATGGAATGGAATGGAATGGAATGGAPPTWCETQVVPSSIGLSDYQCIDFDTGMPATSTWTQTLSNSGTQSLTTSRASSTPNSLAAVVPSTDTTTPNAAATLSWNRVGSTPITAVSVSAYLSPTTLGGVAPGWTGAVSLMCIAFGSGQACLDYTYGSTNLIFSTSSYTGYFIEWLYAGGAAVRSECQLNGSLTTNIWTKVELRVSKSATATSIDVLFAGSSVLVGTCSGGFDADTVSTITVGPKASATTTYSYTMYYDNVVATVAR